VAIAGLHVMPFTGYLEIFRRPSGQAGPHIDSALCPQRPDEFGGRDRGLGKSCQKL